MKHLRQYIRQIILEDVSAFQCWSHSAGFIKPSGQMIILPDRDYVPGTPISHEDYLKKMGMEYNDIQDWLIVTNKSELEMMNFNPSLNDSQLQTFIEYVIGCVPLSKSYDPERHIVNMWDRGGTKTWAKTMPDILSEFGDAALEEKYWNAAMEKLR